MIIRKLEYIQNKLIYFFTFFLVIKWNLLEEKDGWIIRKRIIEPFFSKILYPLGTRLTNFYIFIEYTFNKNFHLFFSFFMNNIGNLLFKYTMVFMVEATNSIIISFYFYFQIFRIGELFFIIYRIVTFIFQHIVAIPLVRTIVIKWKMNKKIAAINLYKKMKRAQFRIPFYNFFYRIYFNWRRFVKFVNRIDDNTYERRLKFYTYALSPFKAIRNLFYETTAVMSLPFILLKNTYFSIIYLPLTLKWLKFFFNAGYIKIAVFSSRYLFKFVYVLFSVIAFFTIANKIFYGSRYPFSKNKDTDILLGNWDPYSNWTKIFKGQLFFFFFAATCIYAILTNRYLVQWQKGAEMFMILTVVGLYMLERRYVKHLAEWEYMTLNRYKFRSKKKKNLFYSLLSPARSFFMGLDNFIKYKLLGLSNYHDLSRIKSESKRREHMVAYKAWPRKLKWVYGNEFGKNRYMSKLFWRLIGGKEPSKYSYMDSSQFGIQMEDQFFSNTIASRKNKRRLYRITNHFFKKWKINHSKRSSFYVEEANPSIDITPPRLKGEQRTLNRPYHFLRGKIFPKVHRYSKRYNLKFFESMSQWNKMIRLGKKEILFKKEGEFMRRFEINVRKKFSLPWIYVKDIRNRTEHFHGSIPRNTATVISNKKEQRKSTLLLRWWTAYDRKYHKLYKRTKSKKKKDFWLEEDERVAKGKKKGEESSFVVGYYDQNFTKLYARILFAPSRKKTRLSIAGRGLYAWDGRHFIYSTIYYWHIIFYSHYFPIWLQNFSHFFYNLLSYIFTIT